MTQIQPSSGNYDTKMEIKNDDLVSSSEQEGEWDVTGETSARRKQVTPLWLPSLTRRVLTVVFRQS